MPFHTPKKKREEKNPHLYSQMLTKYKIRGLALELRKVCKNHHRIMIWSIKLFISTRLCTAQNLWITLLLHKSTHTYRCHSCAFACHHNKWAWPRRTVEQRELLFSRLWGFFLLSEQLSPELPQAAEIKPEVLRASAQWDCWSDRALITSLPLTQQKGFLWPAHCSLTLSSGQFFLPPFLLWSWNFPFAFHASKNNNRLWPTNLPRLQFSQITDTNLYIEYKRHCKMQLVPGCSYTGKTHTLGLRSRYGTVYLQLSPSKFDNIW